MILDSLEQALQEVTNRRAQILEDFTKFYLAGVIDDQATAESIKDQIELVEDRSDPLRIKFYFRLKQAKQ